MLMREVAELKVEVDSKMETEITYLNVIKKRINLIRKRLLFVGFIKL